MRLVTRLLLLAVCLLTTTAAAQDTSARRRRPARRPGPTVPPPGPHVRDNSRRPALPATPTTTTEAPATAAATAPATPSAAPVPLPYPLGAPVVEAIAPWMPALPALPAPADLPPTGQPDGPSMPRGTGDSRDTVPNPARFDRTGLRWFAGAVVTPSPLIPATATAAPAFAPTFLAVAGLELDQRIWRGARWYTSLGGGYGRVDDTPRLRGFGTRRDGWFALGSASGTTGVLVPLTAGPLTVMARGGVGARFIMVDVPRTAWEFGPAAEWGMGLVVGRGRRALAIDARTLMSSFNAERFPLSRRLSSPIVPVRETVVTTAIRWRLR